MENQNNTIKQVIVMRKDLGMRKGKMISQAAHSCMKVFFDRIVNFESIETTNDLMNVIRFGYPRINNLKMIISITPEMYDWITGKFTKICLGVESEEELFEIFEKAKSINLPCSLILDEGLTEFKEKTYTCCAIGPALSSDIDQITGHLKLL